MATIEIRSRNTLLPSPVELSRGHEIIWSANTGRSIEAGAGARMIGDVVAQKQTFQIKWGYLTQSEYNTLLTYLSAGFNPFSLKMGTETINITAYRGTLVGELGGAFGGEVWYKSASVDIVQQ